MEVSTRRFSSCLGHRVAQDRMVDPACIHQGLLGSPPLGMQPEPSKSYEDLKILTSQDQKLRMLTLTRCALCNHTYIVGVTNSVLGVVRLVAIELWWSE